MTSTKRTNISRTEKNSTPLMQELLANLPRIPKTTVEIIESYCSASETEYLQRLPADFDAIKFGEQCLAEFKESKEIKEDETTWPPKAQGVANRLSRFSEAQIKKIFWAWHQEANTWVRKDKQARAEQRWISDSQVPLKKHSIFCSPLRMLIAYYSPAEYLIAADPAYKKYKLKKVRDHIFSGHVEPTDPFIHALRIKFLNADGQHEEAMRLIKRSSAHLNLKGADLSNRQYYRFQEIDLSKSCFENAVFGQGLYAVRQAPQPMLISFPASLKRANLRGVELIDGHRLFHDERLAFINIFSQAEGGLDIRFRVDAKKITLLHELVRRHNPPTYEIEQLLINGADRSVPDGDGVLPCTITMTKSIILDEENEELPAGNFEFTRHTVFGDSELYAQLISTLSEKELEDEAQLCRQQRNKLLFSICSKLLLLLIGIGFALTGMLSLNSPIALFLPLAALGPVLSISIAGLLMVSGCLMTMIGGVAAFYNVPSQIHNFFTHYYDMKQAILQQRLANTVGPQQQDYQFHLLFKKKYKAQLVSAQYDTFTPPEKALYHSLNNREQLLCQKELNRQLSKKERRHAAGIAIMGVVFIAIAALAYVSMNMSLLAVSFSDFTPWENIGRICAYTVSSPLFLGPIISYPFFAIAFFRDAISKYLESGKEEYAIEQMIQQKINALPQKEAVPQSTLTMQLALTSEVKPTFAPEPSPVKVQTAEPQLEQPSLPLADACLFERSEGSLSLSRAQR